MVSSIYNDKKGIYKDLYRTIEAEKISFKANANKKKEDKNTYPLKICAYSNDVGEALRSVIGAIFAKLSLLPAIFYIPGVILSKVFCPNSPDKSNNRSKEVSKEILFQGIASLLLPAILVKSVGDTTHEILDALSTKSKEFIKNGIKKFGWLHKLNENRYIATCESAVGLLALAIAVKPIDYYTEKALDKVYSKG